MSLHAKFRFLLAIFGISVVANVLVSVWCIHVYMGQATGRFHLLMFQARGTEAVRRLADGLVVELKDRAERPVGLPDARYRSLCRQIAEGVADLPATYAAGRERQAQLARLAAELPDSCARYVALVDGSQREEAEALLADEIMPQQIRPLQRLLTESARDTDAALTETTADVADKQATVTAILSGNALAAFLLAAAGVHLVHNWVLRPVDALKKAVDVHAGGDLRYRIPDPGTDELGALARAVNRMADSLNDIQERLVQQERLAAVGEVAATLAHNIRNPLAGIRASAQSAMVELPAGAESRAQQESIIETVDSLSRWLRELLMVSRPIELQPRPTELAEIIDRVVAVIRLDAARRGIRLESAAGADCRAEVDAPRIEQALLAVVDNAVEASPENGVVGITARRGPGSPDWIELAVSDCGPGIRPELRERIATPYFSTKPGGTGIGLHLARRIVQAHGGDIEFRDRPEGGTIVGMRVPAAASGGPAEACR